MSNFQLDSLSHLLLELSNTSEEKPIKELLESAHQGFTRGANDFVESTTKNLQPADIKEYLRLYPLAQILMGVVRFHGLNKDTQIIRNSVLSLLDFLETDREENNIH